MHSRVNARSARALFAAIAAIAIIVGCGESETPGGDSGAADSADATALMPPGLPHPLDTMLARNTFADFARAQKDGNTTTRMRLPAASGCTTGDTVEVEVVATKDSRKIKLDRDFNGGNGYVIARLTNRSTVCASTVIEIPAGDSVYWVADGIDPNRQSHIVNDTSYLAKSLGFGPCAETHAALSIDVAEARARGTECDKMGYNPDAPVRTVRTVDELSFWVACSDGCCYTDRQTKAAPPRSSSGATVPKDRGAARGAP